jgi:hypothetical protein
MRVIQPREELVGEREEECALVDAFLHETSFKLEEGSITAAL